MLASEDDAFCSLDDTSVLLPLVWVVPAAEAVVVDPDWVDVSVEEADSAEVGHAE